ncbi:MAG: hypothetical protein IH571_06660, partial [Acholeplasmataceae bacterium]|nr:hypothetical protein [Acholeplasmataceae bacterium]
MRFMTKTLELNQILSFISMDAKSETIRQEILGLEPMTERFLIEKALDEVQDMVRLISKVGVLPLIEDYDIHQLLKYAELGRVFSVHELLVIRLFLSMEKDILNYFKETEKQKVSLQSLFAYHETMHNHQVILAYINQKMDVDGQIYDDATPDLLHIRKDLNRLDKQLQERLQRLLVDYSSYLNESVIVMRNDRFCIPVKDAFKN